jgi:hypothetical protein
MREKSLSLAADDHVIGFIYTGGGAGATFAKGRSANGQAAMLDFPG